MNMHTIPIPGPPVPEDPTTFTVGQLWEARRGLYRCISRDLPSRFLVTGTGEGHLWVMSGGSIYAKMERSAWASETFVKCSNELLVFSPR